MLKTTFRYIVPFIFDMKYTDARKMVDEFQDNGVHAFTRINVEDHEKESEYDTYEYIKNEFVDEAKDDEVSMTQGCSWKLNFNKPVRFQYYDSADKTFAKFTECQIQMAGLYLFKTGLGLLWYQIDFPKGWNRDKDELVIFQNVVKELNHTSGANLWTNTSQIGDSIKRAKRPIANSKNTVDMIPFLLGQWVDDNIAFLNPYYLPDRKCAVQKLHDELFMNLSDSIVIEGTESSAHNYPTDKRMPDRAILFSYCDAHDEFLIDEMQMKKYTYWLGNGYKQTYLYSEVLDGDMLKPFANVLWYATKEGCIYYARPTYMNQKFFDSFEKKYCGDYFILFIKALFQSYSLLIFSNRIQKEISYDYAQNDSQKVSELTKEINLFMTKCLATSVSHIHHQNNFYNYIKKQLGIDHDVESVTSGLMALEEFLRNSRQEEDLAATELEREHTQKIKDRQDKKLNTLLALVSLGGFFQCMACTRDFWSIFNFSELFVFVASIVLSGVFLGMVIASIVLIICWNKDK